MPDRPGEHERCGDPGVPGAQLPVGQPVRRRRRRHCSEQRGGNPPKRFSETAWEYGGGGNSTNEAAGSYQQGVAPLHCVTDQSGNPYVPGTAPLCRATPDVASISVSRNRERDAHHRRQRCRPARSGHKPVVAALAGNVDTHPGSSGEKGPRLRGLLALQGRQERELRERLLRRHGRDNQPYPATAGWDNATGWGTPDVAHLMQDLPGG